MPNESQALAPQQPVTLGARGVELHSLEDLFRFAQAVAKTPFAPRDFKTPEAIMIAVQYGLEVGLTPMQSLQSVAVVNGKPSLYGDALMAVVLASGLLEDVREWIDGEGDAREAVCRVKRRHIATVTEKRFSVDDAKAAGLWRKQGPWTSYPERMLQMRARGFALRDAFADRLRGMISVEEAQDYPTREERNVTPIRPAETLDEVAARKIAAIEAERAERSAFVKPSGDGTPTFGSAAGEVVIHEDFDAPLDAAPPATEDVDAPVPFALAPTFERQERIPGKAAKTSWVVKLGGICYGLRLQIEDVARQVYGCSSTSLSEPEAKALAELLKSKPPVRIDPTEAAELQSKAIERGEPLTQLLAEYGAESFEDLDPETAAAMRAELWQS